MSPVYFEKDGGTFLNGVVNHEGRLSLTEKLPCLRVVCSNLGDIGLTGFGGLVIDAVLGQNQVGNIQIASFIKIPERIEVNFGRLAIW